MNQQRPLLRQASILWLVLCLVGMQFGFTSNKPLTIKATEFKGEYFRFGKSETPLLRMPDHMYGAVMKEVELPLGRIRVDAYFKYNGVAPEALELIYYLTANEGAVMAPVSSLAKGLPLSMTWINRKADAQLKIMCVTDLASYKRAKTAWEAKYHQSQQKAGAHDAGVEDVDEGDDSDIDAELDSITKGHADAKKTLLPLFLLERIEIRALSGAIVINKTESDRITYAPNGRGELVCELENLSTRSAKVELEALITQGLRAEQHIAKAKLMLKAREKKSYRYPFDVGQELWGRGLSLKIKSPYGQDQSNHAVSVVTSPWQVFMPGTGFPHHGSETYSKERAKKEAKKLALDNIRDYYNAYEAFAWSPGGCLDMTPDDEGPFWAGQIQYSYTRMGLRTLHEVFKQHGIFNICYFWPSGAGLPGLDHARKYPNHMVTHPAGFGHSTFSVDILDRMREKRYTTLSDAFWSFWIASGCYNYQGIEWSVKEVTESAKMLGWDGMRFDGHFGWGDTAATARLFPVIEKMIRDKSPGFHISYNHGLQNQSSRTASMCDIKLAMGSGRGNYMMDESYRHTKSAVDAIPKLQYYGDMVRMHGGYPLVMIDHGGDWNCALPFAAGCRIWPGGRMKELPKYNKFVTRFSAYTLATDLRRLHLPEKIIKPIKEPGFLWRSFCYEKTLSATRRQLVMQLVNVSSKLKFGADGISGVSGPRHDLEFTLDLPKGYQATKVFATDDTRDFKSMDASLKENVLKLPLVKVWTLVVVDLDKDESAPSLANFCREPLDFKAAGLPTQSERVYRDIEAGKKVAPEDLRPLINKNQIPVSPKVLSAFLKAEPVHKSFKPVEYGYGKADFDQHQGQLDAKWIKGKAPQFNLRRDGVLDIHYARGPFYYLNRPYEALARLPHNRITFSSLEQFRRGLRVPFSKLSPQNKGHYMPGFPGIAGLEKTDVLVIDNVPAAAFALRHRRMIAEYVRSGGSLLVLGGWYALSKGAYEGSLLEDVLPVRCKYHWKLRRFLPKDAVIQVSPQAATFLGDGLAGFGDKASLEWANHVEAKSGARVLMSVSGHPLLVAGTTGKGRVMVWSGAKSGLPKDPYWEQNAWPELLARMLKWLGHEAKKVTTDKALQARIEKVRAELADQVDVSGLLDDEENAIPSDQKMRETTRKLSWLLSESQEEETALFATRILFEHSQNIDPKAYPALIDAIIPHIHSSEPWRNLAEPRLDKAPVGLTQLVAEIASQASDKLSFIQIMNWKDIDEVTRLRCLAKVKDKKAREHLNYLNEKLDRDEAEKRALLAKGEDVEDVYLTRLLRPFVNHALISCGQRNEDTLKRLALACVDLPYHAWRQRWVLQGKTSLTTAKNTVKQGKNAVKMAIAGMEKCKKQVRQLDAAVKWVGDYFTPELFATDAMSLSAAELALRNADCHKALPLCLKFMRSLSPDKLRAMKSLEQAKLPEIRNSYKVWSKRSG